MSDHARGLDAATLHALQSSATVQEAAEKLGIKERALRFRCSKAGCCPPSAYLYTAKMPVGQRLKGNSTLSRSDGTHDQWVKTERGSDDPPAFQPVPPTFAVKRITTALDGQGQTRLQYVTSEQGQADRFQACIQAMKEATAEYKGISEPMFLDCPLPWGEDSEKLLTVIPLGDPHIGMLAWHKETGEDFDLTIAERDLRAAIDRLLLGAPHSKYAMIVNVGDFFHAENNTQLTPRGGHKLDVDGRTGKVLKTGFKIMRHVIDRALTCFEQVKEVNVPGNHDPVLAVALNCYLQGVYEREPRVEIPDNFNPYMYHRHGQVLIGMAHGDGAPVHKLPTLMSVDRKRDWGETDFHYWLTGHEHHERVKEYPDCLVETFRTLAPEDFYAHHKGYRSGQSLYAITYHSEYGEVERKKVDIRRARAAA